MTSRHVFIDETKQRDYIMVASSHAATDVRELRGVLRALLLPNQRFLHMKSERIGRKRRIAAAIAAAGVQATVYRARPRHRTEKQRREACLRQLVSDNADGVHTLLVFDQDETLRRWDNQKLIDFTRAENCRETLRYEHKNSSAELLLAVPDAIAWCWAKGGEWKAMMGSVVNVERVV